MKIRRKTTQCLNCGSTLDQVYNYCPLCGQENNDNNVSFGTLLSDFFSTYFALDSSFGRSIKPFFFKPGFLTNRYVEGQRVRFAHPLRLYLIMSLFYFFVFAMVGKDAVKEENQIKTSYKLRDVEDLNNITKKALKKHLSQATLDSLEGGIKSQELEDFQDLLVSSLSESEKQTLKKELSVEQLFLLGLIPKDSLIKYKRLNQQQDSESTIKTKMAKDSTDQNIWKRIDWELLDILKDNKRLSDQQILDSLNVGELSTFDEHIALQSIKINRADKQQVAEYVLKNLPLMMLILIPVFALILKLLYVRRKGHYYIHHLIHGLHLHSLAYLLYGLTLLLANQLIDTEELQVGIIVVSFVLVSTYALVSFKKVYKQKWLKTFLKFNIAGAIYIFCIFVFFMAEMAISMLLF